MVDSLSAKERDGRPTCPYCKDAIVPGLPRWDCNKCGTPHHKTCAFENRRCTVMGCGEPYGLPLSKPVTKGSNQTLLLVVLVLLLLGVAAHYVYGWWQSRYVIGSLGSQKTFFARKDGYLSTGPTVVFDNATDAPYTVVLDDGSTLEVVAGHYEELRTAPGSFHFKITDAKGASLYEAAPSLAPATSFEEPHVYVYNHRNARTYEVRETWYTKTGTMKDLGLPETPGLVDSMTKPKTLTGELIDAGAITDLFKPLPIQIMVTTVGGFGLGHRRSIVVVDARTR